MLSKAYRISAQSCCVTNEWGGRASGVKRASGHGCGIVSLPIEKGKNFVFQGGRDQA
jgi:hypothetical protein